MTTFSKYTQIRDFIRILRIDNEVVIESLLSLYEFGNWIPVTREYNFRICDYPSFCSFIDILAGNHNRSKIHTATRMVTEDRMHLSFSRVVEANLHDNFSFYPAVAPLQWKFKI